MNCSSESDDEPTAEDLDESLQLLRTVKANIVASRKLLRELREARGETSPTERNDEDDLFS